MNRSATFVVAVCLLASGLGAADLVSIPELGVRLQRGFTIDLVADNDMAPDTWCMTFDARGRLVVANSQSIRTLTDTDGDDLADKATVFAPLSKGAMGLCFDGNTLYAVADQALMRFTDADGDGVADGPGEKLLSFGFGEHGAHAIHKGPDGAWYLMGGNDSGFNAQHVSSPDSPIHKIEAGALLRLSADGRTSECIAHGFRNCYGFDFTPFGDILTYDSDTERDVFLPWYEPTRIYHVGFGQHHGWRLTGFRRSWPRPDYYEDTVSPLWRIGRGSPTGVTVYRHTEFPPAYHDGLFFCDWTFGRVLFMPLDGQGTSYAGVQPEVFIEPMETQGFAPTAIAVSPDGALYISIGGRKTRGAVYRIEYGGRSTPSLFPAIWNADLNAVLTAPQPLEAWARASWVPLAQKIGAQPFAGAAADETLAPVLRIRAIEVLTELFGGVPPVRVPLLAQSPAFAVRARLAWSLGRGESEEFGPTLARLAVDAVAVVRRNALDALMEKPDLLPAAEAARVITANLAHLDKRVRMAATRLASRLPDDSWHETVQASLALAPAARISGVLAEMWRNVEARTFPQLVPTLTNLLAQARTTESRLDVVRLMILALGDWHLNDPSVEVFTGYEPAAAVANEFAPIVRPVRALFPSGNAELDTEVARLLAMVQDDEPQVARTVAQLLTDSSAASDDFHYLVCLARLRAPLAPYAPRIAHTILNLNRKLAGQELRTKQSWDARLTELVQYLVRRDGSIGDTMIRHSRFALPAHVELANTLSGEQKIAAARRFQAAVRATGAFPWTSQLVDLLAELPRDEVYPLFRRQVSNPAVRDSIVLKLAAAPVAADRPTFLGSLGSTQPQVVRASVESLLKLPPDPSNTNMVAPLRLLRRTLADSKENMMRAELVALISSSFKQPFNVAEPVGAEPEVLRATYQPVFDWVGRKYPGLIRAMNADDGEDPVRWATGLRTVPWNSGNAARGAQVFEQRGCAACHTGGGAVGPDLAGTVQRMSRDDVMDAIGFPSRDIAPAYRATLFRMRDGQTVNGIIAFESADGWLVQTGAGTSMRLDAKDVVARETSNVSLMPSGLMAGLSQLGIADLYAYLRAMQPRAR